MKKLLLLLAILTVFIVSCGGKEAAKKDEVQTLIVGTNAEYSPFEFKKDGKITGFDYDLMEEIAKEAGITAVIQPGGSIKDQLSIDYCNENKLAMVFTGTRHFKH